MDGSKLIFNSGAPRAPNNYALLSAVVGTGAGAAMPSVSDFKTYQANGTTSAGSGSAAIAVQGSNDNTNWDTIGTITLTLGTSATSDSFVSNDRYSWVRGNVTSISGTNATVNLVMGW